MFNDIICIKFITTIGYRQLTLVDCSASEIARETAQYARLRRSRMVNAPGDGTNTNHSCLFLVLLVSQTNKNAIRVLLVLVVSGGFL